MNSNSQWSQIKLTIHSIKNTRYEMFDIKSQYIYFHYIFKL